MLLVRLMVGLLCMVWFFDGFLWEGGRNQKGEVFGDVWMFAWKDREWIEVSVSEYSEEVPKAMAGQTMCLLNEKEDEYLFIVYGGWDGTTVNGIEAGAEDDIYLLSIDKGESTILYD